jgi:endonuclease/exonuclease/phosphatase family metal-dependent hydrolase
MTLNVWNLSGPWRQRRDEIPAWIRRLEPDVVCLQEIVQTPDGRNQATELAAASGDWSVAYAGRPLHDDVLFGNAILSRWPIDATHECDLPHEPAEGEVQRVVLHARTRGLDVYSTHLNWRFHEGAIRERQVLALASFVDETAAPDSPLPPVVAGDFNADPDSNEIRFLAGLGSLDGRSVYFQDAWRVAGARGPGLTWDNRNPFAAAEHEPDRRIDYVFVGWRRDGGAGRVESARVVCDRALAGTFPSDHFGLLVEIGE